MDGVAFGTAALLAGLGSALQADMAMKTADVLESDNFHVVGFVCASSPCGEPPRRLRALPVQFLVAPSSAVLASAQPLNGDGTVRLQCTVNGERLQYCAPDGEEAPGSTSLLVATAIASELKVHLPGQQTSSTPSVLITIDYSDGKCPIWRCHPVPPPPTPPPTSEGAGKLP